MRRPRGRAIFGGNWAREGAPSNLEMWPMKGGPMPRRSFTDFLILVLLPAASLTLAIRTAVAQSLWMQREGDQTVSIEMLRPNLEGVDAKFLSAAFFLFGRAAYWDH